MKFLRNKKTISQLLHSIFLTTENTAKMLVRFFILLVLFNSNCIQATIENRQDIQNDFVFWEELSENQKNEILKQENLRKDAMDYYQGQFNIGDNDETMILLTNLTLISSSGTAAPLYLHLFNQIFFYTDGALSEELGHYCQKVILDSPYYVLSYFKQNQPMMKKYSLYLGYEFYFKEQGLSTLEYSFSDFKIKLCENLSTKDQYKKILESFFFEIEKVMKEMD